MIATRQAIGLRYGDERLPRYTSYPTAPHFSEAVTASTYAAWLGAIPDAESLSVYLHVPFCRQMCWYCGCHTKVTRQDEPIRDFARTLEAEIDLVAGAMAARPPVRHLHFGGGTPTILGPDLFGAILARLRSRFRIADGAEIAIEVDPRTLTPAMAEALGAGGVTRASLGVQSFDPEVQRAINRPQSFEATRAASEALRGAGIAGINLDLIYGLPLQTEASCVATVEACLALRPDRFSVFGYAHVPGFKAHQRKVAEADLPGTAERLAQFDALAARLEAAGYDRIGLDHFARPEDEMAVAAREGRLRRNFQGYTTDAGDHLLGFGPSAIGRLGEGYVQNEVAIGRWAARVASGEPPIAKGCRLTPDDRLRAEVIERVMCDFGVDLDRVCGRHGVSAEALLSSAPKLRALAADDIVRLESHRLTVPGEMRLLVRSVASAFDAYLPAGRATHSRAV